MSRTRRQFLKEAATASAAFSVVPMTVTPAADQPQRSRGALPWYRRAHAIRHVSLRYFNACGATERCGERHEPETHLIPILLDVGTDNETPVTEEQATA